MNNYNLILLAGAEKGPLYNYAGYLSKAMIPVNERPMLERVIEQFQRSRFIDNIVVVGSEELDQLHCVEKIRKRVPAGINVLQNLVHAVAYVKTRIYKQASSHNGYLISFCDAVFLNTKIIDDTIANIDSDKPDIALHYIEKDVFDKAELKAKRTYIPIDGKLYTGSTIYYIKEFSKILHLLTDLYEMRKNRKDPMGILKVLNCENSTMAEIEEVLSKKISGSVKIYTSPHPGLGMDVDKPSDLDLAREMIK